MIEGAGEADYEELQTVATTSGAATSDPALPTPEQGIVSVRTQVAIVRALIDELDQLLPGPHGGAVRAQVVEELGRLGNRLLQVAGRLSMRDDEVEATYWPFDSQLAR
jgi:hypothetical protein